MIFIYGRNKIREMYIEAFDNGFEKGRKLMKEREEKESYYDKLMKEIEGKGKGIEVIKLERQLMPNRYKVTFDSGKLVRAADMVIDMKTSDFKISDVQYEIYKGLNDIGEAE